MKTIALSLVSPLTGSSTHCDWWSSSARLEEEGYVRATGTCKNTENLNDRPRWNLFITLLRIFSIKLYNAILNMYIYSLPIINSLWLYTTFCFIAVYYTMLYHTELYYTMQYYIILLSSILFLPYLFLPYHALSYLIPSLSHFFSFYTSLFQAVPPLAGSPKELIKEACEYSVRAKGVGSMKLIKGRRRF